MCTRNKYQFDVLYYLVKLYSTNNNQIIHFILLLHWNTPYGDFITTWLCYLKGKQK